MTDRFDNHDGLLDDDPALDRILFEEMRQESDQPNARGCLGLALLILLPTLWAALFVAVT